MNLGPLLRIAAALALATFGAGAMADAGALRTRFKDLDAQLHNNPYHRPIHLDSVEAGDTLKGDIYAVLDHPYAQLAQALKDPHDWCDILILPFNTKSCRASGGADGATIALRIGRKADQPAEEAYPLEFRLQPIASTGDYFESRLTSAQGPLGTRDYRITLEAAPADDHRTLMHLSYSYSSGGMGRMAMQAYLNTAGREKVGFSVVGRDGNGQPHYIGGVRGAIERNVMRYYLAIDAHLASLSAPPASRLDRRLAAWFDSSERYARQLHEMDRSQYMALKRNEAAGREQTAVSGNTGSRPGARVSE